MRLLKNDNYQDISILFVVCNSTPSCFFSALADPSTSTKDGIPAASKAKKRKVSGEDTGTPQKKKKKKVKPPPAKEESEKKDVGDSKEKSGKGFTLFVGKWFFLFSMSQSHHLSLSSSLPL